MVVNNVNQMGTALSGFGNTNILKQHIDVLGQDIYKNKEHKFSDYSQAPHYAAWMRMWCELIANDIFHSYYRGFLENNIYEKGFGKIRNKIYNHFQQNKRVIANTGYELDTLMESLDIIILLRHCIQHGGIPNILKEFKEYEKKYISDIQKFFNPQYTEEAEKIFQQALVLTSNLPKESFAV